GYVDQASDLPNLQILERMSGETHGNYYKADAKRPLNQETRNSILTRYSAGGKFEATALTKEVPKSVDVTLRHPNNLSSDFTVKLAAVSTPAASVKNEPKPEPSWADPVVSRLKTSNPLLLIGAALAFLVLVVAGVQLLRPRRHSAAGASSAPVPLASVDQI